MEANTVKDKDRKKKQETKQLAPQFHRQAHGPVGEGADSREACRAYSSRKNYEEQRTTKTQGWGKGSELLLDIVIGAFDDGLLQSAQGCLVGQHPRDPNRIGNTRDGIRK